MGKKINKIISGFIIIAFILGQLPASAIYIYSAKSRSTLFQENLQSTLPGFRHNVNLIELNRKISIQLILSPSAKNVEVEVVEAEGFGLGIDNTTLLNEGLKIIKPTRIRSRITTSELLKEKKLPSTNKAKFDLKKQKNQQQIIEAVDFKIFNVLLKASLPANYIVKAVVDGKEEAFTRVVTRPPFRL
ncbi:MAG: hypothetical protein HYZ79_04140, partial [Candidatus Melainabacteria bacterium]|nr:hypothetical protein [Candidatus Melainabacteria bacterium]